MSDLSNLLLLLALAAVVGLWLKLSVAREHATREARRQCLQHGLQLLDETVGLRRIRLRRVNGLQRVERCYGFEVSVAGDDRATGHLWMLADALTDVSLPANNQATGQEIIARILPESGSNVVPLHPRRHPDDRMH
ncbi:MAG: DUF3301 domain-containing protein [Rhodanobacter sp.]|jgi:predicted nuclease with RNAse H fold|nr:DUF3301 domain-containing protein [Rhodanobacter sp.]